MDELEEAEIAGQHRAALVAFERDGEGRIGHDARGLVTSVGIDDHAPLAFMRDALGREVRRVSAAGFRLDQAWDAAGQLLRQSAGQGPSDLDGLTAARAKAGPGTKAQRH